MSASRTSRSTPPNADHTAPGNLLGRTQELWKIYGKPYWRQATGVIAAIVAIWIIANIATRIARNTLEKGFSAAGAATTTDELATVARQYKGTAAGAQAEIKLARMFYEEGKFDRAATRFSLLTTEYPKSHLLDAARLGEAFALEADDKTIQAEKRFEEVAEKAQDPGIRLEALIGVARCARNQNKLAIASDWLQKALNAVPEDDARRKETVEKLVAEIERLKTAPPAPAEETEAEPDGKDKPAPTSEQPPAAKQNAGSASK